MRISAVALDYDGTLAWDGVVDRPTREALQRLRASGRKLLMVTGRELPDLRRVFDGVELFDAIVAENGAVLYRPPLAEERLLAPPPPPELIATLEELGVRPLVGRSMVASSALNAQSVQAAIDALGLDWRLILNKHSLMCLPPGVDKASGLAEALRTLKVAPRSVLGVGDAENDVTFLRACGLSAAVANALPEVKAVADIVTRANHGAGVVELIDRLLADGDTLADAGRRRTDVRA